MNTSNPILRKHLAARPWLVVLTLLVVAFGAVSFLSDHRNEVKQKSFALCSTAISKIKLQFKRHAATARVPFTPEGRQNLQLALIAAGDHSYQQAIGYMQKVLTSDPAHPELLKPLGSWYYQLGQHLKAATCFEAYLCLSQESVSGDNSGLLQEIQYAKNRATVDYDKFLQEAESELNKLPVGYISYENGGQPELLLSYRLGRQPTEEEQRMEDERLERGTKQYEVWRDTRLAVYNAFVSSGSDNKQISYYFREFFPDDGSGYRIDSEVKQALENGGQALTHEVDQLLTVDNYTHLQEIYWSFAMHHFSPFAYGVQTHDGTFYADYDQGFRLYLWKRLPEIANQLKLLQNDPNEEIIPPSHYNVTPEYNDKYLEPIRMVWQNYAKAHPIKPALINDWLELIVGSNPYQDISSLLDELQTTSVESAPDYPRRLAEKAGEIGGYLWELEELERRSNTQLLGDSVARAAQNN